uniref:Uncharacterized protein n=1 Tax=Moniliophthora roreri TaxID=221103 RepID=A0A0W0F245_MONRR
MYYTWLARRQTLALWATIEGGLAAFVWYRWKAPSTTPALGTLRERMAQMRIASQHHYSLSH